MQGTKKYECVFLNTQNPVRDRSVYLEGYSTAWMYTDLYGLFVLTGLVCAGNINLFVYNSSK